VKEHLEEVYTCCKTLHYSHLLPYISAYEINPQQLEEFKRLLETLLIQLKNLDNVK